MTGWSNATSSNALPLIPASAVATPKPKTKTAIALKTTVNFTVVVVLSLLVVFLEMVLICVALFSNNTVQNTNNSSSLFWTYSQSSTIGNNKTTYALTPYGFAVIIIGCLLLLAFAYLAYAWFHDELKNVNANKTLWSCLLGSALAFFSICVIVGLVAASVITDRYPNTLDATYVNGSSLKLNESSFGLAFVITAKDPVTSLQTGSWTITLGPSPYGAFTGAMQVVLFVTFAACATVFCFSFSRHEVVSE